MRRSACALLALLLVAASHFAHAAESPVPLVDKYLYSGELARGETALEAAVLAAPDDDQLRFGLGVLQFVRAVERLGQSLHEHGVKSEHASAPFLRLPVPKNPDPAVVRYPGFRRLLDDFSRDLARAEHTLAAIKDDKVKLPIRLARIRLDLVGAGEATDDLVGILKKIMRQDLALLKTNPDFRVCFDRGDVAWLRAYCHLLMAIIDVMLAFDGEAWFDEWSKEVFAKPKTRGVARVENAAVVVEPARLGSFRRHMLQVCAFNRETWRHIRAETDDEHEWLPNPKQKGVLAVPVRDEMIDAWLDAVAELEAVLQGKKLLPNIFKNAGQRGINLRKVLDGPPKRFDFTAIQERGVNDAYLEMGTMVDFAPLWRVGRVFDNPMAVGYAAWFN